MTPEQTFVTEFFSGRIPSTIALIGILVYLLFKGGVKLDVLTAAVQAVPVALAAHKVELSAAHVELKTHTTTEANRVIKVIEDRRISEFGDSLDGVKAAVSSPDLTQHRMPTGRHAAIR